jgi:hypothetical protein
MSLMSFIYTADWIQQVHWGILTIPMRLCCCPHRKCDFIESSALYIQDLFQIDTNSMEEPDLDSQKSPT